MNEKTIPSVSKLLRLLILVIFSVGFSEFNEQKASEFLLLLQKKINN